MLKTIAKRSLNAFGYRVSKVRPSSSGGAAVADHRIDPDELASLMNDLERFAASNPGRGPWSESSRAREYLSNKRLRFYHDLLELCAAQGVTFGGGRDIADIGSGTGYLLRLIHARAPDSRLTGYDTYADITALAKTLSPTARFLHCDLFDMAGERYDLIFNTEVLEHLIRPDLALRHMLGLLREGGSLVLTVPNGRTDTFEASTPLENGHGYWGHINFWSPESWEIFVKLNVQDAQSSFGILPTGENYAIIRTHSSSNTSAAGASSASSAQA